MREVLIPESEVLFRSPTVYIGRFRCTPQSGYWSRENFSGEWPTVVFPRTAVGIRQANHSLVVATPNIAMLYNPRHAYERQLIDPRGDVCEFFGTHPKVLAEIAESFGLSLDPLERPFQDSHSPCSPEAYVRQRAVFGLVEAGDYDPLQVEENFFGVLGRVIRDQIRFAAYQTLRPRREATRHREQVESAKEFIARYFCAPLKLEEIAEAVDCSVFHLCRIFKRHTGDSIHSFLRQLRLRSSIERLLDGGQSLTDLALDLSFSSHSHFTNAFHKCFGLPPKQLRKMRWAAFIDRA